MPFIYVVALVGALGGILFGFDTGAISGAILYLKKDFSLTSGLQEVVTSIALLGAAIGAIVGGPLADRYGRRRLIVVTSGMFVIGSLAAAFAQSVEWLIAARLFIGSAIGIASFVAPLYLSEIAPAKIRGALVSLNQVAVTVGILASYLTDYAFAHEGGWRWMFGVGVVPAIALGIGIVLMPSSPRWLMMVGRRDEAERALARIRGSTAGVDAEIQEISSNAARPKTGYAILLKPQFRMPLIIGIALAALQQVTGINTVIYYAPTIFQFAGLGSAEAAIFATLGVGIVNVALTLVALWLIDRLGRRPLLLIGEAGMMVSLVVLGLGFFWHGDGGMTGWITAASLMAYVGFFAIGLGPVFWLLIAEIYPQEVRGLAMSVATLTNWGMNLVVALTFLTLVDAIGTSVTFWLYAVLTGVALVFTWTLVPETKGRTLEEIEAHWHSGGHPRALEAKPA
ncbi:MAG: sugar porter family MFS transporter [Xanthobacteraceae bacterium]